MQFALNQVKGHKLRDFQFLHKGLGKCVEIVLYGELRPHQ